MENFFGGFLADKSDRLSGSGQNPTAIGNLGNSMTRVKAKMHLPTEISTQTVLNLEKEKGQMAAELELMDQIISSSEKLLGDSVEMHKKNTKWASVTMRADQQLREIESAHGKEVGRYQLGASKTQADYDGYTTIYAQSSEIFG